MASGTGSGGPPRASTASVTHPNGSDSWRSLFLGERRRVLVESLSSSVRNETFPPVTDCTSHCFSRQTTVAPMAKVSTIRNENESFFACFVDFPFFFVYDYFVHCAYPFEMVFFSLLFILHLANDGLEVLSLRFGACRTLLHSF
uniref:(northern house mosquito) hypothetical protein n=1 Tax=Culex pipiens TaxID=7175 RepID=A0A8D8N3H3_CULPI